MKKSYHELGTIVRSGWSKLTTILKAHNINEWPKNEHDLLEWLEEDHPLTEDKEYECTELLEKIIQAKNQMEDQFLGRI